MYHSSVTAMRDKTDLGSFLANGRFCYAETAAKGIVTKLQTFTAGVNRFDVFQRELFHV